MWTVEIRCQPELLRWSQDKVRDEQAQIFFRKCCGHSWWEPPWWRKLESDGKSILDIITETPWYWGYIWQRLNLLLCSGIFMPPYRKKCMGRTRSIISQCGTIMNMTCNSVTKPMTWWVWTHLMSTSFQMSFLMRTNNYSKRMNFLT